MGQAAKLTGLWDTLRQFQHRILTISPLVMPSREFLFLKINQVEKYVIELIVISHFK
jgi:hypothetical protein